MSGRTQKGSKKDHAAVPTDVPGKYSARTKFSTYSVPRKYQLYSGDPQADFEITALARTRKSRSSLEFPA